MADVRMDFKSLAAAGSMLGSGAMVVCAEGTCMLDMALNAVRFFRNESCGKCVPCRVGSQKMVEMLTEWTQGRLSRRTTRCLTNFRSDETDFDLRARTGGPRADRFGAEIFSRGSRSARYAGTNARRASVSTVR